MSRIDQKPSLPDPRQAPGPAGAPDADRAGAARADSSNLLSRIKQVSSEFDFGALLGGSGGAPMPAPADQSDDTDAFSASDIRDLYRNPPPLQPDALDIVNVPAWERGNPPARTPARQSPLAGSAGQFPSVGPADSPVTAGRPSTHGTRRSRLRRRPGRPSFLRASAIRLLLCGWTVLIGASLGIGVGAQIERLTAVRVLPNNPDAHPAAAVSNSPHNSRSAYTSTPNQRKPGRSASSAHAGAESSHNAVQPDPYKPYKAVLFWPVVSAGIFSLLWIAGAPAILRYRENSGYILLATLALIASTATGSLGIMAAMEQRAAAQAALDAPARRSSSSHQTSRLVRNSHRQSGD